MKSPINLSLLALVCAVSIPSISSAATFTWDGGAGNGNWTNSPANWNNDTEPTFNNTADIKIAGTVQLNQVIRSNSTIRSLEFTSTNLGATTIGMIAANGTTARDLTFSADVGNATLTIDAAATGVKTFNNLGDVVLLSNLDITHNGAGNLVFAARITGSNAISLAGTGTTVFSALNTYTGNTTINAGTLKAGLNNTLPSGTGNGNLVLNGGASAAGTFDLNGFDVAINGLAGTSSTVLGKVLNNGAGTKTLTLGNGNATASFAGVIGGGTGTVALTRTGTGTQTLSGTNTYTGTTLVSAGALAITNSSALGGTAGDTTVADGAALRVDGTAGDLAVGNEALTLNGTGIGGNGALRNIAGTNTWAGAVTLGSASTIQSDAGRLTFTGGVTTGGNNLTVQGAGDVRFDIEKISGNGGVLKNGNGTLTLAENNNFSGGLTLNSGTVVMGGNGALGAGGGMTTVNGGTLDMNGFNNSQNGNVVLAGGSIIGGSGSVLNSTGTFDLRAGSVAVSMQNSGNLAKTTADTVTLSGVNTYSGNTTISEGTLALQGTASIADSPVVAVASGAFLDVTATTGTWALANSQTLSGAGTILGNAAIFGIHSPGSSPGIQAFSSDLTYSGGTASMVWELTGNTASPGGRGSSYDGINVGGNLDFLGATTVTLVFNLGGGTVDWSDVLWGTDQNWLLYDVAGTTTNLGNLSIFTENWADNDGDFFNTVLPGSTFGLSQTGADVYLNYTAGVIPEPSRMLLIGCGMIVALLRRRR